MRLVNAYKYYPDSKKVSSRVFVETLAKKNRDNRTSSEEHFAKILNELGFDYEFQKVFCVSNKRRKPKFRIVDFYLYRYFLVIEIDGGYHNTGKQKKKDFHREISLLGKPGIKSIIRFTDDEVFDMPVEKIKTRIDSYIY